MNPLIFGMLGVVGLSAWAAFRGPRTSLGDFYEDAKPGDFRKGQRVQLHPATDRWMRGDRYGEVIKVGKKHVHVHMDRSGQKVSVAPRNLTVVD